jgi:hypothetical protein
MLVHDPDVQELNAVLKDHNSWGNDEEIGRLSLPIRDLPPGETKDIWLELGPPKATSLSRISRKPLQAGMQVRDSSTKETQRPPDLRSRSGPKVYRFSRFDRTST